MKKITLLIVLWMPLALFSQWTFQKVDNGFDEPYKIAFTAKNNDALLKLEPVETEVALVVLLEYNAPDVLTFVTDPLPSTTLFDVAFDEP